MTKNYTEEQMSLWIQRTNLDKDVVSFVNGKLEFNELKKQSFIYKQHLKKQYKDGFSLVAAYEKNRLTRQSPWRSLTKTPTIFNGLSFKFATFATWNIKQT